MATAAVPKAALQPSSSQDRFFRAVRLSIRGGTTIARGLFDSIHHPLNLPNVLSTRKKLLKRKCSKVECKKLFPSDSSYGKSEDFDLHLLLKLLRTICNLTEPCTGWNELPDDTDLSLEADVARVRYHRNVTYAHNSKTELSEVEFGECWEQSKGALLRIVGNYSVPSIVKVWEEQIDYSRTGPITDDDIRTYVSGFPAIFIHVSASDHQGVSLDRILEHYRGDQALLLSAIQDALCSEGAFAEEIHEGSIEIQLRVKDLDALEDFWRRYQTGELRKNLERVLVTEEMRKLGDKAELIVTVHEDEYLHARCFLEELLPYKKKDIVEDTVVCTAGITAEEIHERSTEIKLRVKDLGALEDFWKRYQTNELKKNLENVLLTEEIRKLGDKSELILTVPEDEYLHARCFLEELLPYKKKDIGEDTVICTAGITAEAIHEGSTEIQLRDQGVLEELEKRRISIMASDQRKTSIPLVLPSNCSWNELTGECETNTNVARKTLDVQQNALDQLREIKGNVCVVSIAGPCRQGKSYILSRVFDQGQVFPLGSKLDPETMGIWLWVVPEKFQDSNGREFTVVLLDSEGTDAASGQGSNDNSIFTLSVLLSSIMIYNSVGRPTRSDLDSLDFIVQLSQRIHLHTNTTDQDDKHFYEAFPYFIWLLRDVLLELPDGCDNIKEYFMEKVLNDKAEGNDECKKAAESILTYFSGFNAFSLPPPAYDPKVVKDLNNEALKSEVNPQFLKLVEEFKSTLHSKLSPKKSINEGEFVTGEALAVLVELFVDALNTPGAVPNVQNAWDTFVEKKCREVLSAVLEKYAEEVESEVKNMIPCEADVIRAVHEEMMERCRREFHKETFSLSVKSVDKYLETLSEKTNPILSNWLDKNRKRTEEHCNHLIKNLKNNFLDPVIARLPTPEGPKMEFGEIVAAYNMIEQEYKSNARGAKEVQATVFLNFHPELQNEMEQNINLLQNIKDYDQTLVKAKAEKVQLEEQRLIMEEKTARIEEEKRNKERELVLLREKQEEEKIRLQEMYERNKNDYQEQLNNMMQANLEERRKEREEALAGHKTLAEMLKAMTLDIDKKDKRYQEMIENMNKDKARMQESSDKKMEEAKDREERLFETIDKGREDQRVERAEAKAREERLQKTMKEEKSTMQQMHSESMEAAADREEHLHEMISQTTEDQRQERAAVISHQKYLEDTIERKEMETEEVKKNYWKIKKPWR